MPNRCAACSGPSTHETIVAREMMMGLREEFAYRRCTDCRSLWLQDPPDDMARFYGSNYYSFGARNLRVPPLIKPRIWLIQHLPMPLSERMNRLPRGIPDRARWVSGIGLRWHDQIGDIGSGDGRDLRLLSAYGFTNLWGFDPFLSEDSELDGVHLRSAGIDDVPSGFKLLMFHHSLEHVADPLATLIAARERLTRDGHILVRIPLADSHAERTYDQNWVQLDPPRHLWVPSLKGMLRLAERAGLEIVSVFYDSYGLQFWGSEQYARDVPLHDPRGVPAGSEALFTASQVGAFEQQASLLNMAGDGDAAGFFLRSAGTPRSRSRWGR